MPCVLPPVAALAFAALLGCRPPPPEVPEASKAPPDAPALALSGGPAPDRVDARRPVDPPALASSAADEAAAICGERPGVRACRIDRALAHQLGLARDHGMIALATAASGNAWAQGDAQGPNRSPRVSLVLHDRALRPIGEASLAFDAAIRDVAIAPTPGGWLLAAAGESSIEVLHLTRDGREEGVRTRVTGGTPRLVEAADAPLLVWSRWGGQGVDVLAAPVTPGGLRWETQLFDQVTEPNFGGEIATTGGDFLIARRAGGVSVARLSADGRRTSLRADVGGSTEYPILAACSDGPRMIWSEFGRSPAEVRWTRLDADGAVVGEPVRLSGVPDHFNLAPSICDGADTIVLLTGYIGGTGLSKSLDLVRVDREGRRRREALRVSAGSMIDPRIGPCGPEFAESRRFLPTLPLRCQSRRQRPPDR